MKTTEQHIEDLHFEHKLWKSEADFYRDELKIYKEQVENVSKRNSASEVKDKVKYFQDQFESENRKLESLQQEIATHEHDLASIERNNFKGTGGEDTDEHGSMRRKHYEFKENYTTLKNEFR